MTETWKDVDGFENYEVNNFGEVRSKPHCRIQDFKGRHVEHCYPGRYLKPKQERNGYLRVHLTDGVKDKWCLVHRLVAEAFCNHEATKDIVNHLDNDPSNNYANNLEWTDYKGNMQWATKQKRMHYKPDNIRKAHESHNIPVIAIDNNGNEKVFDSITHAADELGLSNAARKHVSDVCKGHYGYNTAGGFKWRYYHE